MKKGDGEIYITMSPGQDGCDSALVIEATKGGLPLLFLYENRFSEKKPDDGDDPAITRKEVWKKMYLLNRGALGALCSAYNVPEHRVIFVLVATRRMPANFSNSLLTSPSAAEQQARESKPPKSNGVRRISLEDMFASFRRFRGSVVILQRTALMSFYGPTFAGMGTFEVAKYNVSDVYRVVNLFFVHRRETCSAKIICC